MQLALYKIRRADHKNKSPPKLALFLSCRSSRLPPQASRWMCSLGMAVTAPETTCTGVSALLGPLR